MIDPVLGAGTGRTAPGHRAGRVLGIDVARGTALLGMFAAHVFDTFDDDGAPTPATVVVSGRSVATFVLLAGVGLALVSGGSRGPSPRDRPAVAAAVVVRALVIGAIGLTIGVLGDLYGVTGILPFYAVLFLLAVPLLGCPPAVLAAVAAGVVLVGPVVWVATVTALEPYGLDEEPTLATLVDDPLGLAVHVLVTGWYPVVVYLAYICAGLAIGRLDLGSRRVAWWLVAGGATAAVLARLVAAVLLHPLGGLRVLTAQSTSGDDAETVALLLWEPDLPTSWWYLALPAPHSHTPVDLVHSLGCAAAVLGAALLLTRVRVVAYLLGPLAAAGATALTLYCAHLVVLATGVGEDEPVALFVVLSVAALTAAVLWRRFLGRGPLERMVAAAAGRARGDAAARSRPDGPGGSGRA